MKYLEGKSIHLKYDYWVLDENDPSVLCCRKCGALRYVKGSAYEEKIFYDCGNCKTSELTPVNKILLYKGLEKYCALNPERKTVSIGYEFTEYGQQNRMMFCCDNGATVEYNKKISEVDSL